MQLYGVKDCGSDEWLDWRV